MGTGVYQCYCQYYPGDLPHDEICDTYNDDELNGFLKSQFVSISTVLFNYFIREVNMKLITFIGFHTESQKVLATRASIFIS